MRRRIAALLEEKEALEAKNQDLVNSVNEEKKVASDLRQQVFGWQRMYHEAIISLNSYKVRHADMMQNISACLKDMNVALPHLIGLTNVMCQNKTNLTSQLNYLRSSENGNHQSKVSGESSQVDDSTRDKENEAKHCKVGPMVKGFPIQKPTVLLERVALQPLNQDSVNSDMSPTEANLSPITEENEEDMSVHMSQISMRRRRKFGLGSAERWRMRKLEQLNKDRHIQEEQDKENWCNSVAGDSSDSDTPLVPVIQLQRISGLLLSPNPIEIETGRASVGKGITSKQTISDTHSVRRTGSNPTVGCSWKNVNLACSSGRRDSQKPTYPPVSSDSSDEEREASNVQLRRSLYSNNIASCMNRSRSLSGDTSKEASDFSMPDSTSNTQESPARDSLGTIVNASAASCKSLYADTLQEISRVSRSHEKQKWLVVNIDQAMSGVTSLASERSFDCSLSRKRSNSFSCDGSPASLNGSGKRIRKPKIHSYPGEEDVAEPVLCKKKKVEPASKVKKKLSPSKASLNGKTSVGKSSLKRNQEVSRRSSFTPSAKADCRVSQGKMGSSLQKLKTSKKSSLKKSIETPRNSAVSLDQSSILGEGSSRGSRRAKVPVSYKESPLNVKMRRPI